ncbi:MAG: M50 family metallopeptidase [Clostridia bacterium]|nr:M50 family metallopeptidase [Clostridia bacterium]
MTYLVFPRLRMRLSLLALPAAMVMLWLEGWQAFSIIALSALLHELGHIAAIYACGYRVRRVDVLPMGAIIALPEGIPDRIEAIIALSGPAASCLCGVVSLALFLLSRSPFALLGVVINLSLGLFNLLPVRKLDGGKALCCILRYKNIKSADRISACASYAALMIFVFVASLCVVLSGNNLGVLLLSAALILQLA